MSRKHVDSRVGRIAVLVVSLLTTISIAFAADGRVVVVRPNVNVNVANRQRQDCDEGHTCTDRDGFLSIKTLHLQLDDDRDGQVDIEESDEFLREELQYENGKERQKGFHNNKKPITVSELWEAWKQSDVRNWTVEQTVEWLSINVELPEYAEAFRENLVTGATLPRLATDMHFISTNLGIKNPIDRRKISLKATDVVLFGSGAHNRGYIKDGLLLVSVCVACIVCWFAYVQHKCSKRELGEMMRDMEGLQRAEESLQALQHELEVARQMQESVLSERDALEKKLKRDNSDSGGDHPDMSDEDVMKVRLLEEKLDLVTDELYQARRQLEMKQWLPPAALQLWLQLTYELESHYFNTKKAAADAQLKIAKDGCEKLRKKGSTLLGSFRVAHGGSIDDIDEKILQAKTALTELTQSLKERLYRWNQVEMMCGFNILKNPGLATLQTVLPMQDGSSHVHHNGNLETIDDEMDGSLGSHISAVPQQTCTKSTYNPLNTWHAGDYHQHMSQPSPPPLKYGHHRAPLIEHQNSSHSLFESIQNNSNYAAQKNAIGGYSSAAHLIGNSMLTDIKRSHSTVLDHMEHHARPTHLVTTSLASTLKQSCSENSLSSKAAQVSSFAAEHHGASVSLFTNGFDKATFIVGGGPNAAESSPDEVEDKPSVVDPTNNKNSSWRKMKSFSQDRAMTPPREVVHAANQSKSAPTLEDTSTPPSPTLAHLPATVSSLPPAHSSASALASSGKTKRAVAASTTETGTAGSGPMDQQHRPHGLVFSAAKRLGLRGTPSPVDEEKSSDSSSTIDDDVKKEKKKKMFLKFSQKLRRL